MGGKGSWVEYSQRIRVFWLFLLERKGLAWIYRLGRMEIVKILTISISAGLSGCGKSPSIFFFLHRPLENISHSAISLLFKAEPVLSPSSQPE
jgi:hypothetical protein